MDRERVNGVNGENVLVGSYWDLGWGKLGWDGWPGGLREGLDRGKVWQNALSLHTAPYILHAWNYNLVVPEAIALGLHH